METQTGIVQRELVRPPSDITPESVTDLIVSTQTVTPGKKPPLRVETVLKQDLDFVSELTRFFTQPDVIEQFGKQRVVELVELFGNPEIQRDNLVLQTLGSELQDVLQDTRIKRPDRLQEVLDRAKHFCEAERVRTALNLKVESGDRKKLEELSGSQVKEHHDDSEYIPKKGHMSQMRNTVVAALKDEKELKSFFAHQEGMRAVIDRLSQQSKLTDDDIQMLRTVLGDESPLLIDLESHAAIQAHGYNQKVLGRLKEEMNDSEYMWNILRTEGIIPTELLSSFEDALVYAHLQHVVQNVSDASVEERSKALLPFIDEGLSATFLIELAEGRFEVMDDLLEQQTYLGMDFLDMLSDVERNEKLPLKVKKASRIVTASLISILQLGSIMNVNTESLTTRAQTQQQQETKTSKKIVPDKGKDTVEKQQEENQNIFEDPEFNTPENSPGSKKERREVLWNLSGDDLTGYYRTHTGTEFYPELRAWKTTSETIPPYMSDAEYPSMHIEADIDARSSSIVIPLRESHYVSPHTILFTDPKTDYNIPASYHLTYGIDGSVTLQIDSIDPKYKTVHMRYGLYNRFDENQKDIPEPDSNQLKDLVKPIIDPDKLPDGELKEMLQELRSNNLDDYEIATRLESYVKSWDYSTNPKYSDDYRNQTSTEKYINRMSEVKKVDCDVANTALVAMLRTFNIPSRMVYGYRNDSGKALDAMEGHGWSEVWIYNHWIRLDATPGKISIFENIKTLVHYLEDKGTDPKILSILLGTVSTNLAATYLDRRQRSKTQERSTELMQTYRLRSRKYFGSAFNKPYPLDATEKSRLTKGLDRESPTYTRGFRSPLSIFRLAKSILLRKKMESITYPIETSLPSDEPGVVDFLSSQLGYDRDTVTKEIEQAVVDRTKERNHPETRSSLFDLEIFLMSKTSLRRMIKKMNRPDSMEIWEKSCEDLRKKIWNEFESKKQVFRKKWSDHEFTREELNEIIEERLRYKLIEWSLADKEKELK